MALSVRAASSRSDVGKVNNLPFRLHANVPQWVPPLRLERRLFLHRRLNAYFRHAEAELFLAERDGQVVGRISAQIDRSYDGVHGDGTGMFGFLELEDDPEVMDALLDAAGRWLADRGRTRMLGPMDFTMNEECGVLVEGFDREPLIKQPWHPPYFQTRCEEAGLVKAMDLLMWELEISDREKMLPAVFELAARVEPEHGIRLRKMSRRTLRRDLDRFAEVYNSAWSRNWDFVPYTKEDLDHLAQGLQLVFDPHWFMVAETAEGDTVGVAITLPDINQVLKRCNGRILPFGWVHFLRRNRIIDRVRVGFLGVKPEFQHTGVAAKMYVEHFDLAGQRPQTHGEMGWILETNDAMNRGMEAMNGRVVKRYRMYERGLSGAGRKVPAS